MPSPRISRMLLPAVAIIIAGCTSGPAPTTPATAQPTVAPSPTAAAALTPMATPTPGPTVPPTPEPPTPTPTAPPAPEPTTTPQPTAEPPATTAPTGLGGAWPPTDVAVVLGQAYDTSGAPFDPAELDGLAPGDVTAWWYREGDLLVAVYGVDLSEVGPLCPGNSLSPDDESFEFVSNAPTAPGGCANAGPTLAELPLGVLTCATLDGAFAYRTAVPADAAGTLYASVELFRGNGSVVGITGAVATDAGPIPQVDLEQLACRPVRRE